MNIVHLFNNPKPANQPASAASFINDAGLQILQNNDCCGAISCHSFWIAVLTLTPPLNWFCQANQFIIVTGGFK